MGGGRPTGRSLVDRPFADLADRDARASCLGASRRWEGQIERGLN